ncbi:PREDICTED: uncharacterized protein LOC107164495 isoform X2 [Diuraphis noxia]|uniref:uncharacterized protein LOC107164495 isoform X2 n=1 Tax=Diuraphis noxia TaxID=143948 RepID=UPI00076390DD|nr:PREDICTED: uncharacterized protein LOC107164495 isoform X2 [Diuraphis noxia]
MMLTAPTNVASKKSQCIALLVPVFLPALHIMILEKFWSDFNVNVNKEHCTCSCWDTVFKGPYEAGVARYKHMYFNATDNTFKIWAITAVCTIVLYECVKNIVRLCIDKQIRYKMMLLFILSMFSHYYSWWSFVNYWNDDFYSQWNHQIFFTVTELYSTGLTHMLAAGFDQFVINVIGGSGFAHQVIRDLFLMIPDILNIIIPLLEIKNQRLTIKNRYADDPSSFKEILLLVIIVTSGLIIVSLL